MKDRFDLENEILFVNHFAQHLRNLAENVIEFEASKEDIADALEGLAVLVESHGNILFHTFTEVLNLDTDKSEYDLERNKTLG